MKRAPNDLIEEMFYEDISLDNFESDVIDGYFSGYRQAESLWMKKLEKAEEELKNNKIMRECLEKLYDRGACGEITICLEQCGYIDEE